MIGCVLLAGVKSSRMNGIDKALVKINNKTLLQLILDKLKIDNNKIVLNTNRDANNFKDYNLNIINDTIPNFQGPLAGILSGLEWFDEQDNDIEWVVSLPIDTPFFPEKLVGKLFTFVHEVPSYSSVLFFVSDGYCKPPTYHAAVCVPADPPPLES